MIAKDKLTQSQRQAIEEFKAARGTDISAPFIPLLRSPEVMSRIRAVGDLVRYKTTLPPRLSEFVILLTARKWAQQYEWDSHAPIALAAGLATDTVEALAEGRRPPRMASDEEAVYALVDELHRNQSVSDATYQKAITVFGEQGVIDALSITGYYTMLAMVLNTARTPSSRSATPALKSWPR